MQGIYLAPSVVASSLKTAIFASKLLENLGYTVSPKSKDQRADIVQTIEFKQADKLIKFCQGIQAGSAIDSSAVPTPYDMPRILRQSNYGKPEALYKAHQSNCHVMVQLDHHI